MQIRKVLMVDDDPLIRRLVEISLTRVGKWEVALADSGAQALELLGSYRPDVILLDVMMPAMDGPTTLRVLRENEAQAATPVIFITAKVQSQEIMDYNQLGAWGVIPKPFDPLTLPNEIQKICNEVR